MVAVERAQQIMDGLYAVGARAGLTVSIHAGRL